PQPYLPSGYDGVDNNQNGLIDEWAEGVNASNLDAVRQSLLNHTHETARSEMLYALLVEGPYNVFNRDDFTAREVGDTDGDGLPEFLDAWGKPLQFYRWPLYYTSDLQKGSATYNGPFETRQQNPLDPNQQLLAPAWWANRTVTTPGSGQVSTRAALFQNYFFSLIDPLADPPMGTVVPNTAYWDRSALSSSGISYRRRAYFFKFLIASAGPNQRMGIARYADATVRTGGPTSPDVVAASLILIENQAARSDLNRNAGSAMPPLYQAEGAPLPDDEGADDITNHTLNAPGTGLR
ncbi:MAG TPA: hypothetical protein VF590_25780, partial [Isosphaeraceae bacterium]